MHDHAPVTPLERETATAIVRPHTQGLGARAAVASLSEVLGLTPKRSRWVFRVLLDRRHLTTNTALRLCIPGA